MNEKGGPTDVVNDLRKQDRACTVFVDHGAKNIIETLDEELLVRSLSSRFEKRDGAVTRECSSIGVRFGDHGDDRCQRFLYNIVQGLHQYR